MRRHILFQEGQLIGGQFLDKLNRRSHRVISSIHTPNDIYWFKLPLGIGGKGISMLNLRHVEFSDTYFYIKPFRKE